MEILMEMKFDEIVSKLYFKNMMGFNLTKWQHTTIFQVQK